MKASACNSGNAVNRGGYIESASAVTFKAQRRVRKCFKPWGHRLVVTKSATVRMNATGKVTVLVGTHSHGQSHETTLAQVAADELGVPLADVRVIEGDTTAVPYGWGTWGKSLSGDWRWGDNLGLTKSAREDFADSRLSLKRAANR